MNKITKDMLCLRPSKGYSAKGFKKSLGLSFPEATDIYLGCMQLGTMVKIAEDELELNVTSRVYKSKDKAVEALLRILNDHDPDNKFTYGH